MRADPSPPRGAAHLLSVCQDDDDGHLLALQIIRDLVDKGGDVFLDQLARLGVINKVSTLAGPASDDENEDESKPEKVKTINDQTFLSGYFWVKVFLCRVQLALELLFGNFGCYLHHSTCRCALARSFMQCLNVLRTRKAPT